MKHSSPVIPPPSLKSELENPEDPLRPRIMERAGPKTEKTLTSNETLLMACLLSAMQSDGRATGKINFDAIVPVMQRFEGNNVGIRGVVQRYEKLRDRFRGFQKGVGEGPEGEEVIPERRDRRNREAGRKRIKAAHREKRRRVSGEQAVVGGSEEGEGEDIKQGIDVVGLNSEDKYRRVADVEDRYWEWA